MRLTQSFRNFGNWNQPKTKEFQTKHNGIIMKFIVSSTALFGRLQAISRVINSKNSLPVLDCFLMKLTDGTLFMTASDNDTTLSNSIETNEYETIGNQTGEMAPDAAQSLLRGEGERQGAADRGGMDRPEATRSRCVRCAIPRLSARMRLGMRGAPSARNPARFGAVSSHGNGRRLRRGHR